MKLPVDLSGVPSVPTGGAFATRRDSPRVVLVVVVTLLSVVAMALPAAAATRTISGTVACQNGGTVNGVWIQSSAGGSRWADFARRSGAPWIANFSKAITTSASRTDVELHIGCGGTPQRWGSNNKTRAITVSGSRSIHVRCNDVSGHNGYRCRGWGSKTALVGMPFEGWLDRFGVARPTSHHTSGDVSSDLYAAAGTTVRAYAFGHRGVTVTMRTAGKPTSTCGRGETLRLNVYWNGEHVGWVSYGHLKSIPASLRASGVAVENSTVLGKLSAWAWKAGCWEVTNASGIHTHYTAYNVKNFACLAPYTKKQVKPARWIGLVGHSGASTTKKYCSA